MAVEGGEPVVTPQYVKAPFGGGAESVWGARVRTAAGIGGAGLVLGLGLILMVGSLQGTSVF